MMQITEEFRSLFKTYEKKYRKNMSFSSLRLVKNSEGEKEPVFFVGVPGLMVALCITFTIIVTVYLLYLPFMWYVWTVFAVALIFLFRIAMKLDKAKQIRFMVYHLMELGIRQMEKASGEESSSKQKEHTQKALTWLEKADKWVDEPHLKSQIELLRNSF